MGTQPATTPPQNEYPPGLLELIQAIKNYTNASQMSTLWRSDAYTLTAGQSKTIVQENRQRRRVLIFTDAANTSGVGLSAGPINADLSARAGLVVLGAGAPALEMTHCGEIHAMATTAATVYVVEEYAR